MKRLRHRILWGAFALGMGPALGLGCVAEPATDGKPLLCGGDEVCEERFGDGWRCISGGCVLNEAPRIT
ncbi:MAG: hypothetical protein AAFQ82_16530, partial [Myxococcota bacterium]